jgi:uncharacterized membrane protein required for colicin V production
MFALAVITVLLVSIARGFVRGALRDVLGLAALAMAWVASEPFARGLGPWLAAHWGMPAGVAYIAARVGAGLAVYVSLTVSATVANRCFGQDETGVTAPWNRNLGAVLGLVYGLALVLIAVFLTDSLHKAGIQGGFVQSVSDSWLGRYLSPYNPADRFLLTDTLKLLRQAQDDPEVIQRLRQEPAVQALLEKPDFRAVLDDRELADAIRNKDYARVVKNPNLQNLLKDTELMRQVLSPQVRDAIRKAVQERGNEPPATP